jgi:predicted nucleic acid-binding protein
MNPELPKRVLVDTGVLLRWLKPKFDSKASACAELVDALLHANRDVLIAAPTIAEILRFGGGSDVPHRRGLIVVPFDDVAARVLGRSVPIDVLDQLKASTGVSKTMLKYDAMIVACAVRHRAEVVVSLDSDCVSLGQKFPIRVTSPVTLLDPQPLLPHVAAGDEL